MTKSDRSNMFCKLRNLHNESDVEQNFVVKLLDVLGFTEDYVETKKTIPEETLGKGKKRHTYRPDYVTYLDKKHEKPVLIIDAKNPSDNAEAGLSDAQLYASIIRRKLKPPKPDQFSSAPMDLRLLSR